MRVKLTYIVAMPSFLVAQRVESGDHSHVSDLVQEYLHKLIREIPLASPLYVKVVTLRAVGVHV